MQWTVIRKEPKPNPPGGGGGGGYSIPHPHSRNSRIMGVPELRDKEETENGQKLLQRKSDDEWAGYT